MTDTAATAATDAARALAARRPTRTITCEVCGGQRIVVAMKDERKARTCGAKCRLKLHRREKAATRNSPSPG